MAADTGSQQTPTGDGKPGDDLLARHLREARILVAYLSRSGREVPTELFESVSRAARTPLKDWDSKAESRFWEDFNKLSQLAQPATIETIEVNSGIVQDIDSQTGARRNARKKVVGRYSLVALLSMVVVLILQIYWVVGTNVLQRTLDAQSDLKDLESQMTEIEDAINALDRRIDRQMKKLGGAGEDIDVQLLQVELNKLVVSRINLKASKDSAQQRVNALFKTLGLTTLKIPGRFAPGESERQIYIEFQKILNTTAVEYFLPLLLGLLGASVYVLRHMSIEIRNETFLPENAVNYRLRLYLGMIAGLTFAWLFAWLIPTNEGDGLGAASPLAIAFIVGYSVEVLFSALDRAIGYFTRKDTAKAQ